LHSSLTRRNILPTMISFSGQSNDPPRRAGAWRRLLGTVTDYLESLETPTAIGIAVVLGALVAVFLYFRPPWGGEAPSGPSTLDVSRARETLVGDPLDHATRLELARYYLQWGLAVSRSQMPMDESASDSELKDWFEKRLVEWAGLGENVEPLREMLRRDFGAFRERFVTAERGISKRMFEESVLLFRQTRALGATLSARDLYDLGTAYYQLGPEGYEGAARFLGEAVARGLVSARALTFLGNVAVARSDFEQGITFYRKALDHAPDDPILAFNLALAYKERGNYAPAIEFLRATLRLYQDKENVSEDELSIILQSRLALGWCLLKQNRFNEAIQQFEILLENQPDLAEGYYWLGIAYEGLGRYELARVHWQRAERLQTNFRDVRERLAGVDRLLNPTGRRR
jgi:tetratricopeptide (TPR) repeat protein